MDIRPSERLKKFGSYAFADVDVEVSKLKKQGVDVIDFGVGDPKEETPVLVRDACKKAIDKRKDSGYPSYIGTEEFRKSISDWYRKRFNVSLDPSNEISSNIGAKEGVFNFHEGIVNQGDCVIMPNPGYPPYERGTLFSEGKPYFYPLLKENNFLPSLDSIPKEVVKKARLMWINYPSNPTSAMANKSFFKEVIDFGHDHNIIIASDECYTEMYYDKKPMSILELDREGVVVMQSMSKRSNMTCYRVGWLCGDERIVDIFKKVKTNIDSGTATFIQDAAVAALKDEKHVEEMRRLYRQKRDIIVSALKEIGLDDCTPQATFYIWQKVPHGMNSVSFAKRLVQKDIAMVVTPGAWISKEVNGTNPGENYVRIALVPDINQCREAAERLKKVRF